MTQAPARRTRAGRRRAAALLLLWLVPLVPLGAPAQESGQAPALRLPVNADGDGDGRVDREEFHHQLLELFLAADRDGDLALTPAELDAAPGAPWLRAIADPAAPAERLVLWDFVHAGLLSFRAADANQDGVLDPGEATWAPPGEGAE